MGFALALAAVAFAHLYRLDRPLLWGDEGHTAAMARGILRSGVPSAFDGRNLLLFDIRAGLNTHLVSKEVPWVQWYAAAVSMALFGATTAGVRAVFALSGVLAFIPLWAALRGRVKLPELVAALALLAPQALLFDRNARYYPILVLLFACLVWHMGASFRSPRIRFALSAAIFVLLFHTHTLVATGVAAALALHCLLWRRDRLRGYLGSAAIGFATWAAWYKLMGPPLTESPLFQTWAPVNGVADWCAVFVRGVVAMIVDMDAVGSLPLLLLAAVAGVLIARRRPALAELARDPLVGFVLLGVLVQAAGTAAVSGTETAAKLAVLRYMPHFAVFGTVACLVALDRLVASRTAFAVIGTLTVATNLGTLSHWASPFGRSVPVSWAAPVYADILDPAPEALDGVIAKLRREAPPSWAGDRAVIPVPAWTQATLMFYLGDRYIVPPDYIHQPGPHDDQGDPFVRAALGSDAYARLYAPPLWLVDSLDVFPAPPDGLAVAGAFPSLRARPDDGARPELTRHTFNGPELAARVVLYRWQEP
jgi:hypothetical protein